MGFKVGSRFVFAVVEYGCPPHQEFAEPLAFHSPVVFLVFVGVEIGSFAGG